MADREGEFNFFQRIHVRIGIRIDFSISIRPMITRFGNQIHLEDLTQIRIIKQVLVRHTWRSPDKPNTLHLHYQSVYGHQTWQDGNLSWWPPAHKVTWPFDHVVFWNYIVIISPLPQCLWPTNLAGWLLVAVSEYCINNCLMKNIYTFKYDKVRGGPDLSKR